MQNDTRDRLVKLIQNSVDGCASYWAGLIADHLIANGVIVPPCKVGTKVYVISSQTSDNHNLFIFEDVIDRYIIDENGIIMCFTNHLSKSDYRNKWDRVFTDKSKAEAKLKELNEK